jgi:hypothetical protein
MAMTVSLPGDWLENIGNRRAVRGTVTFDTSYTTGGEALTAANVGLGVLEYIDFNPVAGFTFVYDYVAGKVKAFAAGQSALPNVVVTGGQGAGPGLQITPDSNAGVLGKTTATTRTIPGATFGLVASGAGASGEVAATTDLSVTPGAIPFYAVGR